MPEISSTSKKQASTSVLMRLERYIQVNKLIGQSDRVLCMVSGGPDSTAMVRLLKALSEGDHSFAPGGFSLGIIHVNYGMRGKASDDDEDFVRELGDELKVPVHAIKASAGEKSNFQAWARDIRYEAAQNLCRWQGYTKIAAGHNRDDRIETFLYRLISYSGRGSLLVMPPRRGKVIRPLLFLNSSEIRNYCKDSGIRYCIDKSNESTDYRRNQIRQELVPRLEELRPDFRDRIEDSMSLLEDEDEVLKTITREAWDEAVLDDEYNTLSASAISFFDKAIARLVLRRWLAGQKVRIRVNRRVLDSIIGLCAEISGTRSLSLSDGVQVERQYDNLKLIIDEEETVSPEPVTLPVPGEAEFGEYVIKAEESGGREVSTDNPMRVTIDGGLIEEPLGVRSWSSGDRFSPLGMSGTKSIQDFFVDAKIPKKERDTIPLITSGDEIVWVCGLRISENYKATENSRGLIELEATRRQIEDEF